MQTSASQIKQETISSQLAASSFKWAVNTSDSKNIHDRYSLTESEQFISH